MTNGRCNRFLKKKALLIIRVIRSASCREPKHRKIQMAAKPPMDGFLSPELDLWRQGIREQAHKWFSLAEDLNRSAVHILTLLDPNRRSDRELGAAALFARTTQSYEAAVLLTERGLLTEAGCITRSMVENAIYLAGFAIIQDFPKRLAGDTNKHYFQFANTLAQLDTTHISADDAADLKQLTSIVKEQGHLLEYINLHQLAKQVGMEPLYNVVYRHLSDHAAHPSVKSIGRHIYRGSSNRIQNLIFAPQREGLESILSAAITTLIAALEALTILFPLPDIREAIRIHDKRHHELASSETPLI